MKVRDLSDTSPEELLGHTENAIALLETILAGLRAIAAPPTVHVPANRRAPVSADVGAAADPIPFGLHRVPVPRRMTAMPEVATAVLTDLRRRLAMTADPAGLVSAPCDEIADSVPLGISRETVRRALHWLHARGAVEIWARQGGTRWAIRVTGCSPFSAFAPR